MAVTIEAVERLLIEDVIPGRLKKLNNLQIKELPEIVEECRKSIAKDINNNSTAMFRMFDGLDILICLDVLASMPDEDLTGKSRINPLTAFGIYVTNTKEGGEDSKRINSIKLSNNIHERFACVIENFYNAANK